STWWWSERGATHREPHPGWGVELHPPPAASLSLQLSRICAVAAPREQLLSCAFDLDHYVELLDAARGGGYRFAFFDREPQAGDLLLRHDVDMSLESAVTMAELEAERDVAATYFLMTRSDFYNLDAPSGVAALARLRELGHR